MQEVAFGEKKLWLDILDDKSEEKRYPPNKVEKKDQMKHYIYVLKRTQRLNKAMVCSLSLNLSWTIGTIILD